METRLFVSPKNPISAPIRQVDELRFIYLYNSRSIVIEFCVVSGDHRIMGGGFAQLGS
jgi:hypothetical protein